MKFEPQSLSLRRRRRQALRSCHCEPLECRIVLSDATGVSSPTSFEWHFNWDYETQLDFERISGDQYPGGVSVSPTHIFTDHDVIPRFVAEPTITSIRSGNWSDPGTWSLGRVPTDGDRVAIAEGTALLYSQVSDSRIDGVEISGTLVFSPLVNTRMIVANLTVMPIGRLQIGRAVMPVASDVKAELVIADKPLDPDFDPKQYGTGLIALGTVTVYGSKLDQTWIRLAVEPTAGDSSLLVADNVDGWKAGDRLALPDTRQALSTQETEFTNGEIPPQWEEVVVNRVEGNRVFLAAPLQHNHPGARNPSGQLELLPHVALLSRNVIIRSENPAGTRGHTFFTARTNVDIEYADFQDLGRTDALLPVDNTVIDSNGNVTHLGTNQIGRYAAHLHHVMGPENPTNTGYQYKFVGNTVERSLKWAVALHDTSFGLVSDNVVYSAQGAGFVTEDGSEIGNLFRDNIAIRIQGTHIDGKSGTEEGDYGRGGSGFWFRRGGNLIVGNVAADSTYAGFVIDGYYSREVVLPLFRGADKHEPGQGVTTNLTPATLLSNNEAYGMTRYGLWAAFVSGNHVLPSQPVTLLSDLRLWNILKSGVQAYHTARLTFDRLLVLGNLAAQDRNHTGTVGVDLATYENLDLVIRNSRVEGVRYGILAPRNDATRAGAERPTVIQNTTLKSYINIIVSPPHDNRPSQGNVLDVRDVRFELLTTLPNGPIAPQLLPPPANIQMHASAEGADLTQPSIVRVYNYNQDPGDNFQVFYREQLSTFVLPQTDPALLSGSGEGQIGSPKGGLTNSQNWATYGISMGGAIAPTSATLSRPEINGLTAPIQDWSLLTPRVVLVTPWNTAVVSGGDLVRLRYNVVGLLPPGTYVYFQLDGGARMTNLENGGIPNVAAGMHSLYAYIGDAGGTKVPGTIGVTQWFFVKA